MLNGKDLICIASYIRILFPEFKMAGCRSRSRRALFCSVKALGGLVSRKEERVAGCAFNTKTIYCFRIFFPIFPAGSKTVGSD
jgi:hypothetical protein